MIGRNWDEIPGDEGEPENDVLPSPYVAEERALRDELVRLDGILSVGPLSVIAVPRPGGSGHVYLSGRETLLTSFIERAYEMGEDDARRLVQRYPTVLVWAEVVVRGRRTADRAASAVRGGGGRSTGPSQLPRGRAASGSADDAAQEPGEEGGGEHC